MLSLLRKYQKIVFATAGLLVIFSMCFFGMTSQNGQDNERPNVLLGTAIDGSKVYSHPVSEFVHFLNYASHPQIGLISESDDVLMNHVFKSGLATMLLESYYDTLKEDLEGKLEVYSKYRPYQHPQFQFISAENVWTFYAPEIGKAFKAFKEESEPLKKLDHMVEAYMAQSQLSEHQLRRVLYMQEQQFGLQQHDPTILQGNLALFNARTPQELLGPKFISLAAQSIHNGALYAKQKGHKVSFEEAKASLMEHAARAYASISSEEEFDGTKAGTHYKGAFKKLMLPEKKVVHMWQNILLFERLFDEADGSVFLDTLAYDQINQFTKESLNLNVYALPESLAVTNFEQMMKLEVYLDNVAKRSHDELVPIPTQFYSVDRVKSRCPKLLAKHFNVEVATVAKSELALQVGLKELYEYETLCFNELKTKFPELALKEANSTEEKLAILDQLDPLVKVKLDEYVKEQIIAQNENWIYEAFEKAQGVKHSLALNIDDTNQHFVGFEDNNQLIDRLEKALADAKREEVQAKLQLIGQGDRFYSIQVLEASDEYRVLSYKEADQMGVLGRLVDEKLEREYPSVRMMHGAQFKNDSGEFLPLDEVREDVGRYVFSESIGQLQTYLQDEPSAPQDQLHVLDRLASFRMHHFMQHALNALQEDGDVDSYVAMQQDKMPIEGQFKLVVEDQTLSRSEPTDLLDEQLFRMKAGEWSSIAVLPSRGLGFYHLKSKKLDDSGRKQAMEEGHALLVEEARRHMFSKLISEIQSHHAIHLTQEV